MRGHKVPIINRDTLYQFQTIVPIMRIAVLPLAIASIALASPQDTTTNQVQQEPDIPKFELTDCSEGQGLLKNATAYGSLFAGTKWGLAATVSGSHQDTADTINRKAYVLEMDDFSTPSKSRICPSIPGGCPAIGISGTLQSFDIKVSHLISKKQAESEMGSIYLSGYSPQKLIFCFKTSIEELRANNLFATDASSSSQLLRRLTTNKTTTTRTTNYAKP